MRRTITLFGAATLLGAGLMLAAPQDANQAPPPPQQGESAQHRGGDPNRQVQMLTKRLNLTSDQQQQLLPILTDRQQQLDNIRNDSSLSGKDRRDKVRSVRDDSDTKIKAILTDQQKQAYDKMQAQMRERMQERHDRNQNPPPNPQ